MVFSWLRKVVGGKFKGRARARRLTDQPRWKRARPYVEALEDRLVPSVAAYLNAGGSPWGLNPDPNVTAMNAVFGPGNWDQYTYSSPGAALSGSYKFLFLEGGNGQGPAFESFISSHLATLENLVSNGTALLMNAARNSWTNVNFSIGFGATLEGQHYAGAVSLTSAGVADLSGPATPVASSYTGSYFSHDVVVGSGFTPFITATSGPVGQSALAGRQWGAGYVMIGGWTFPQAWSPSSPQGNNLIANIVQYTESQSATPGVLRNPLANTQTVDATRGYTWNSFFADPLTGKVYFMPGYAPSPYLPAPTGTQAYEYPDLYSFVRNTNATVINLPVPYEGTYHAALGGFLYYDEYNTNTLVKVNASDGTLVASATLPNAGHTNGWNGTSSSAWSWGGFSDIDLYVDSGNTLYVMWADPNAGNNIQVSRLDPNTLTVQQTWTIPQVKSSTGFGFIANGVVYLGNGYATPDLNATYNLATGVFDTNYNNPLTSEGGDYITDLYWDPATNQLFEQDASHNLVYPNAVGNPANISVTLDGSGNLVVADKATGGPNDNLTLQADTTNGRYVIHDPNNIVATSVPGAAQPDSHTVYVPFSDVTGSNVYVNTLGAQDTLTVDYSLGSFAGPGKAITFDGQSGSDNTLDVTGPGTFSQEVFDYTSAHNGDVLVTDANGTTTINYANLMPVNSSLSATDVTLNLPAGAQAVLEAAAGTPGSDDVRSIGGPGFETTTFANPSDSLTVNTAGGGSLVQLAAMDSGFAPTTENLSGQAGDRFQLTSAGAIPSSAGFNLTAATLDLNGYSPTLGALSGTGTITNGAASGTATLTLNSGTVSTFAGVIQDGGSAQTALWVDFPTTLILTGANTYTGATTIYGGIQVGDNGTTGSLAAGTTIINNDALGFDRSDAISVGNTITGYGVVGISGGTVTLTTAETSFGGTFSIASGATLAAGVTNAIDGSAVSDGGTLELNGYSVSLGSLSGGGQVLNSGTATPTLTVGSNNTPTTFTGRIQEVTGGYNIELDKVGAATLTLGGTQDNGGTQAIVDGGTLVLAKDPSSTSPDVHAVGRLTINNGGTAQLAGRGGDQIYDGDPAGVTVNAGGTFDLNGRSETVGGVHLWGGTIIDTVGGGVLTSSNTIDGQSGSASAILAGSNGLSKTTSGTLTFSGADTYTGTTSVTGGTLTVNGDLNDTGAADGGLVNLNAAGVTLNGSGTINGQVVVAASDSAANTHVDGVTVNVPAGGVGITVLPGATFAQVGVASGVTVNGNATSTGVLVEGSAKVFNSRINGNNVGVNVNALNTAGDGLAALQNDNLDNNTAGNYATGLLVQNGAIVDAGQLPASATPLPNGPAGNVGYYGDITGLFSGTPLGSSAHSAGGNSFAGYTPSTSVVNPSVPQAIRDLNTGNAPFGPLPNGVEQSFNYGAGGPLLGRMDVTAQNNSFGAATSLGQIEQLVFHDLDNNAYGFVNFATPSEANPAVVGPVTYFAANPTAVTDGTANPAGTLVSGSAQGTEQMSVIRYVQVTYSSYVFLDPNLQSATSNSGLDLVKLNGPYGAGPNTLIHASIANAAYDQNSGQYTVTYALSGPGTEYGSLEDGNYSLAFNEAAIQAGGPGGASLSPAGDPFAAGAALFHRYFGDSNGDAMVDETDFAAFRAAYRSRLGGTANYQAPFDFNGDGFVDSTDYYQFLRRYRSTLNGDGTVSALTSQQVTSASAGPSVALASGTLVITGTPHGVLTLTEVSSGVFQVTDNNGATNLGSYAVTGNLDLYLTAHPDAININLNGYSFPGTLIISLGNGDPAGHPVSIYGGTVNGNVMFSGGSGLETLDLGLPGLVSGSPVPLTVRGVVSASGKNSSGGLVGPGDTLYVGPGSTVPGTVSTSQVDNVDLGEAGLPLATVGNLTVTDTGASAALAVHVFGDVIGAVSVGGTNYGDVFDLEPASPGVGGHIRGSLSVTLLSGGSVGNYVNLGAGSSVGTTATLTSVGTAGTTSRFQVAGSVGQSLTVNLGAGNNVLVFTGAVGGTFSITAGNGNNDLGGGALGGSFTGTVGGNLAIVVGAGNNYFLFNGLAGARLGGTLSYISGGGNNWLALADGGQAIQIGVRFSTGNDTFQIIAGSTGKVSGSVDWGDMVAGNDTLLLPPPDPNLILDLVFGEVQ